MMKCPRCESNASLVSEYYDFEEKIFYRDSFCPFCKSAVIEKFHENGRYQSEWIDFNV